MPTSSVLTRREVLLTAAGLSVSTLFPGAAQARETLNLSSDPLCRWLVDRLAGLRVELRSGGVGELAWQEQVGHYLAVLDDTELRTIVRRARDSIELPDDRAGHKRLHLRASPSSTNALPVTLFGLKKGRAIVPHAHNHMTSAHLVLDGELHVRTYDRLEDQPSAVRPRMKIRPAREDIFRAGDVVTMSRDRENVHWMVAVSERAHTFDIPVTQLMPLEKQPFDDRAHSSMVFLDPDRAEVDSTKGGELIVPIIDPAEGIARYGHQKPLRSSSQIRRAQQPTRTIAVTVDDLPTVGPRRRTVAKNLERLIAHLTGRNVPAYGFACGDRGAAKLMRPWTAAGLALGNHTLAHKAFSKTKTEVFLDEIVANEERYRAAGVEMTRVLRLPFLDHGHDDAKHDRLEAFLKERGMQLAHVTLDDMDYNFATAYGKKGRTDTSRRRVADLYLRHMAACTQHFEDLSRKLYGRHISQILLVHANELNADHLGRLLDQLRARGYRFIRLEEAMADDAYKPYEHRAPAFGKGDRNFLTQVALARGLSVQDVSGDGWFDAHWRPLLKVV